jgi:hypothetical protein
MIIRKKSLQTVYRYLSVMFFFLIASALTAQSNALQITEETGDLYTFQIRTLSGFEKGFALKFNAKQKIIPQNIELNDKPLWLTNSSETPKGKEVVSWTLNDEALYIQYNEHMAAEGDVINIKCKRHAAKEPEALEFVSLYRFINESGALNINGFSLATKSLSPKSKTN